MAEDSPAPLATWDHSETVPVAYGDTDSYSLGLKWLRPCASIEDWGCGKGWARTKVRPRQGYLGIDGSPGEFVDRVADLREYRSDVPGIFMRHVLEHNHDWRQILDNAVASFSERMALILFTPLAAEKTQQIDWVEPGVPDIAFKLSDLTERIPRCHWRAIRSPDTHYGMETLIYASK